MAAAECGRRRSRREAATTAASRDGRRMAPARGNEPLPEATTGPILRGNALRRVPAFSPHFDGTPAGAEIGAGRAEHVCSEQTTHFNNWEELATFVATVVGGSAVSPRARR